MSFRILFTFALGSILLSAPAHARNVQKAECVGPAGAPVKAIYLHGWFPPKGNHSYINLEENNRDQIEKLAAKLNVRIAIPLATDINEKYGHRQWATGYGVTANRALRDIEAQSSRVCGAPLAPQRSLIGFSNGGYAVLNIALSCDEHLRNNYTQMIMMGAKTWSEAPPRNFAGCPRLTAMAGKNDDLQTCVKGKGCRSFADVAEGMKTGMGGNVGIESYNGGHVLAPNARLAQLLGGSRPPNPNTAPTPGPVIADKPQTPPAVAVRPPAPSNSGGSVMMIGDIPATK